MFKRFLLHEYLIRIQLWIIHRLFLSISPLLFLSYNSVFICHTLCPRYVVKNIHGSFDHFLRIIIAFNQLWVSCRCYLARNGILTAMIDDRLALVHIYSHIIAETAVRSLTSCKTSKFAWNLTDCFLKQSQPFMIGRVSVMIGILWENIREFCECKIIFCVQVRKTDIIPVLYSMLHRKNKSHDETKIIDRKL